MSPAGYLLAGPALVRQEYSGSVFSVEDLDDRVDSPGSWIGYRALFPAGVRGAAVSVAVEDIVPIRQRRGENQRLLQALELSRSDGSVGLRGVSHLPMIRVGLALRLQCIEGSPPAGRRFRRGEDGPAVSPGS